MTEIYALQPQTWLGLSKYFPWSNGHHLEKVFVELYSLKSVGIVQMSGKVVYSCLDWMNSIYSCFDDEKLNYFYFDMDYFDHHSVLARMIYSPFGI